MESAPLLSAARARVTAAAARIRRRPRMAAMALFVLAAAGLLLLLAGLSVSSPRHSLQPCIQTAPLVPTGHSNWSVRFSEDKEYIAAAAERLAGAVRIKTQSFDAWRGVPPPDGDDPVHSGFPKLHQYLASTFPRVHQSLERRIISRYSLLYIWKGKNASSIPPLVFMSHQDTVPVLNDTLHLWTYPPFSGYVDIENDSIWGRGSVDTKATIVGALESIEVLLERGFQPSMDVYLAFGYDEEISGHLGAKPIAEFMEIELGLRGKVGLILDEGLDSFSVTDDGVNLAVIATAEKGYLDYHITVETGGGHSSLPPKHTGIGIMSLLVAALEANPHPLLLTAKNPYLGTIVCTAEHSAKPDPVIRSHLKNFDSKSSKALADYLAKRSLKDKYRMASSQAVDIIHGGLKINALPEQVTVDINNRISIDSSASEFQQVAAQTLMRVAETYNINFTFNDFLRTGQVLRAHNAGADAVANVEVFIRESEYPLEPSPITARGSAAWNIVEGTIHHVYERDAVFGRKVVVAPGLMAGNTDTRHYWNLTRNIMRFSPATGGAGYHTVDEHASVRGYMAAVTFFHELIRNYDEHGGLVATEGTL
ncbi:hypothetical protein HDU84_005331 [Entophlyctis sp. JEL0112]|nr:hypothetical protein HDU84_005331 [Entophlyctis sp. JEL0112]